MKDKYLKILSPITLTVVGALDVAVIGYLIFAFKKLLFAASAKHIVFTACVIVAATVAILVTKEVLSHGVKFYEDELEFVGLDDDNIFAYNEIVSVETHKDTKASFVKNFVDRQSSIIFNLKNDKVVTIDIGLTTKNCLEKIKAEIDLRINNQA